MSILDQAVILQDQIIPDDIPLMELADKVVRGKVTLSPQQQRMLIEMLPYIAPKLSATANVLFDGTKSFADALERCIERSKQPPQLNGRTEPLPLEEAKRPMSRYRRF